MIRAVSLQKSGLFKSEVTRTSMVPCFVLSPFPPAIRSIHRVTTGMESSRGDRGEWLVGSGEKVAGFDCCLNHALKWT